MKKFAPIISCVLLLFSCTTEDKDISTNAPYPTEAGKQALEDNGIAMLTKIDDFKDDLALKDIEGFIQYLIIDDEEEGKKTSGFSNKINKTFINVMDVKQGSISPIEYASRQTKIIIEEEGLMEEYNDLVGNYTWNDANEEWNEPTVNPDGDILFTVTNEDNKTAILKISNFSTIIHESDEEVPTSLNISLKVDGSEIFSHSFSANFTEGENAPNTMSNAIKLGALSFNSSMNNDNSEVELATSLKLGDATIIGATIGAQGEFTELNQTGDSEDSPEDVLKSANVRFTMLNASISVTGTSPKVINENGDIDYQIGLMNENIKTTLTIGDKKIADGEFYKINRTYTDYQYHYDPKYVVYSNDTSIEVTSFNSLADLKASIYYTSNNYYFIEYNYWEEEIEEEEVDLRFVFADGTKSDMETYFELGFEDIIDKLEEVEGNFEERFEDIE